PPPPDQYRLGGLGPEQPQHGRCPALVAPDDDTGRHRRYRHPGQRRPIPQVVRRHRTPAAVGRVAYVARPCSPSIRRSLAPACRATETTSPATFARAFGSAATRTTHPTRSCPSVAAGCAVTATLTSVAGTRVSAANSSSTGPRGQRLSQNATLPTPPACHDVQSSATVPAASPLAAFNASTSAAGSSTRTGRSVVLNVLP